MGIATEGLDAIVAGLPESTAMVQFSMHTFLNPVIVVDADTAAGSWLMWIASIIGNDPPGGLPQRRHDLHAHRPGLAHPQRRHPSRHAPLRNVRGRRCDADVMRHLKPTAGQITVRRNHSRTGGATSSIADSATIQCGLPGWS